MTRPTIIQVTVDAKAVLSAPSNKDDGYQHEDYPPSKAVGQRPAPGRADQRSKHDGTDDHFFHGWREGKLLFDEEDRARDDDHIVPEDQATDGGDARGHIYKARDLRVRIGHRFQLNALEYTSDLDWSDSTKFRRSRNSAAPCSSQRHKSRS